MTNFNDVKKFMETFGQEVKANAELPNDKIVQLRIKLIEVEKNDTINKLIEQMEVTNSYFRKDWFYLLNNLTPNEPIHPKQKLKIVSRHY